MQRSTLLAGVGATLGAAALIVTLRRGEPPGPAACDCPTDARLVARVRALEARLDAQQLAVALDAPADSAAPGVAPIVAPSVATAPAPASAAAPAEPVAPAPRYTSFRPPSAALTIVDLGDGNLEVTNGDPSMTGQTLQVPAVGADGAETTVTIVVPPPP